MKNNYYKPTKRQLFLLKQILDATKKLIGQGEDSLEKERVYRQEKEEEFAKYLEGKTKKKEEFQENTYYPEPSEQYFDPDFLSGDAREAYEEECAVAREMAEYATTSDWDYCEEDYESDYDKERRMFGITWYKNVEPSPTTALVEVKEYHQRLEQYASWLDSREKETVPDNFLNEVLPQYTATFTEISFDEYRKIGPSLPQIEYYYNTLSDLNMKKMTSHDNKFLVEGGRIYLVKHQGYVMFLCFLGYELYSLVGDYGLLLPIPMEQEFILAYISSQIMKKEALSKEDEVISHFVSYLQFYHVLSGGELDMELCRMGYSLTYIENTGEGMNYETAPTKVVFDPQGKLFIETVDMDALNHDYFSTHFTDSLVDSEDVSYLPSSDYYLAERLACINSVLQQTEEDIKQIIAQLELELSGKTDSYFNQPKEVALKYQYAQALDELSILKSFYEDTSCFLEEHASFACSLFTNMDSDTNVVKRAFAKENCGKKILI